MDQYETEQQETSSAKSHKTISTIIRERYSHSLPPPVKKRGRPPKHRSFPRNETTKAEDQRKPKCYKQTRTPTDGLSENEEAKIKSAVRVRAREVQAKLLPKFPSIIKYMLKSHVTTGFWLGLPSYFCIRYLPVEDTAMILEDEKGEEFEARFLALKGGLSGGWRGFSISHKVMEGDAIVFQLVEPKKFKVYIVRSNGSDGCTQMDIDEGGKHQDNETSSKKKVEERCLQEAPALGNVPTEQNDHGSDNLDPIMLGKTVTDFNQVRSIEDFTIFANGVIINSHLSEELEAKYYELCSSQKEYLHNNLLEGLNCQLIAGIIKETVNIVDATRAAKLDTPHADFVTWLKTLRSFQGLGMSVGFLIVTVKKLMEVSWKWELYEEVRGERVKVEEEKRNLVLKLVEVNEKAKRLDMRMKKLDVSGGRGVEEMFREVACGAW